jgi:hypothetical protein
MNDRRMAWIFAACACLIPIGYACYTHHIWEDYFITFRYSQNLCDGHGLAFNPGERVHGFTSPLGVLLPALCYLATGRTSYVAALWIFRCLGALAYCGGGLFIWRALRQEQGKSPWLRLAFAVFYLLQIKAVAFSVNGMETGLMLLFVGWGLALAVQSPSMWPARAVCWAGLMWTRPDGCIYVACLAVSQFVFSTQPRKELVTSILKSGMMAALLYVPWFAWAWSYFGSPIPQTVAAKAPISTGPFSLGNCLYGIYVTLPHRAAQMFDPIYYAQIWDQPAWISRVSYGLGICCAIYWLFPVHDRLGRSASLCFVLLCAYFSWVQMIFPWYLPPVEVLGLVVLAMAVSNLANASWMPALLRRWAGPVATVAIAGEMAVLFLMTSQQMMIQQKEVELGNRAQIGLWLRDHVSAGETVYAEPIGYIGYFSQAHMLDYPGLVTPRVVQLRREQGLSYATLIDALQPDWAVLRHHEIAATLAVNKYFRNNYIPVKSFDVKPRLATYRWLPGKQYLLADAAFMVFKKVGANGCRDMSHEQRQDVLACQRILYPMMKTPMLWAHSNVDFETCSGVFSRQVLLTHPDGQVTFERPVGARQVSGQYGIVPKAYEDGSTDGVDFVVEYVPAKGSPTVLFEKCLDPKNKPEDRGMHRLEVALPASSEGCVVLRTRNLPGKNTDWDWSYWTGVEIK